MKQILIVVDMQNDFIDGALGSAEAVAMTPAAAETIRGWEGPVIATLDTHLEDYMDTAEGKKLPVPHCIKETDGWKLAPAIEDALTGKDFRLIEKPIFGSVLLPELVNEIAGTEEFSLTLIGLCTDICVVSNALLLKANFPEVPISVIADCCAGVTPAAHEAALSTMRSCQIDIL
jgi:nicotinamidase-related amidase